LCLWFFLSYPPGIGTQAEMMPSFFHEEPEVLTLPHIAMYRDAHTLAQGRSRDLASANALLMYLEFSKPMHKKHAYSSKAAHKPHLFCLDCPRPSTRADNVSQSERRTAGRKLQKFFSEHHPRRVPKTQKKPKETSFQFLENQKQKKRICFLSFFWLRKLFQPPSKGKPC
jgi:hypothetical protein